MIDISNFGNLELYRESAYIKAYLTVAILECGDVVLTPSLRSHLQRFLESLENYDFSTPPEREEKSAD